MFSSTCRQDVGEIATAPKERVAVVVRHEHQHYDAYRHEQEKPGSHHDHQDDSKSVICGVDLVSPHAKKCPHDNGQRDKRGVEWTHGSSDLAEVVLEECA